MQIKIIFHQILKALFYVKKVDTILFLSVIKFKLNFNKKKIKK